MCLRKTRSGKSYDYRDVIVFEKLRFQNVFRPQQIARPAFSNSSGLKSVFEKLFFRDGLVWMVGLTVFSTSLSVVYTGPCGNDSMGSVHHIFIYIRLNCPLFSCYVLIIWCDLFHLVRKLSAVHLIIQELLLP